MLAPPAGSSDIEKKSSRVRSPPNRLQFRPWSQIDPRWLTAEAGEDAMAGREVLAPVIWSNWTCQTLKQLLLTPLVSFGDPDWPVGHVVPLPERKPVYHTTSTTPARPAEIHGNMLLWALPSSACRGALQVPGVATLAWMMLTRLSAELDVSPTQLM